MQHPTFSQAAWRWLAIATASAAAAGFLATSPARAQDIAPRLQTESPYFFVKSQDPSVDKLPLKATNVDVRISGVIADVTVTQQYRNEGTRPIEAKYVFPGSTRAAVQGMNVRLGDRLVTAQIKEKQKARIEYDQAKNEGKTAALLEQHLPNVFQMNVANILPGDDVKVELHYTELLVPQAGNYQFVFPTVVGPRYNSPQSGNAGARWVAQPILPAGEPTPSKFDIKVDVASPIGIKEVRSRTHPVEVTAQGDQRASVALVGGAAANDRDFILDYRLAGDRIESGVMLYRGPDENYFLAMVEPPKHVQPQAISPREYIFVVDISGSMHGFPLDTAKAMLRSLIGGLKPSDSFNVLVFEGSNKFLAPKSVPATRANIERAIDTLERFRGGGSTELIPALSRVYAEPKASQDVARTIVVVTDGYVTVEREAFELVRKNLSQANLFAFGIGSSVNRHLIEGLARAGMGEPFVILNAGEAPEKATRFRQMIESPVLTSVKARFDGLDVYDVEPKQLPDVLGERPVLVFGKWRGEPDGQVVIEGRTPDGPYRTVLPVAGNVAQDTPALRSLWARHRIASLTDQEALEGGDRLRAEITELGLHYSLLTQYTSFLAVDRIVRNTQVGDTPSVDQPSPMPQGVSNLAVGAEVPGTPEPASWGAVLVLASVLAMLARRARRQRHGFTA
ncbi:VIT and vWA domain-containing protein [Ramlibacter algicola]|uniref:VWA domain-containing protein n=1 Tax=Ramlibacter algicola TaxID=2795217 RepID=A0A934Q3R4_9BURK|nr:VIT and VWA domain-containing protein [Ramlibacter algicola]MBK0393719.1 VWA domain-containing protein [Ramlibacter algicola]